MSRITAGAVALFAVLAFVPAPSQSQVTAAADSVSADTLPSASSIFARYIEVLGGRELLASQSGLEGRGTFELPAQGITGNLEIYGAAPSKLLVRVTIPGLGLIRTGYDGQVAWSLNPAIGPMVLEGRMLDQMRQEADFYGPLSRDRYVASMETVGVRDFEGRPCFEVKVVTNWDETYVEFYDTETGLLAGSIRTQESPMGAIETTTVLTDYRATSGFLVPMVITQRMMGQEQRMRLDSLVYGPLNDSLFVLPQEIKPLVKP